MSSPAKKKKFDYQKQKKFYGKSNKNKEYMEPGQAGFLATCNFREKDCVRECYAVLNEFADMLYGKDTANSSELSQKDIETKNQTSSDEEEEDISKQLTNDIAQAKQDFKAKSYRFKVTNNANVTNCVFINAKVPDVVELGVKIVQDIFETKKSRTKNVLRFIPVEAVCKANIKDIVDAAGKLFDKYLLKEPKTFSIVFNHRLNNSLNRDQIIKELAELVTSKNINNKVDLKNAQVAVVVEVLKGYCCLSVLPDYFKFKKYNLTELVASEKVPEEKKLETENKSTEVMDDETESGTAD